MAQSTAQRSDTAQPRRATSFRTPDWQTCCWTEGLMPRSYSSAKRQSLSCSRHGQANPSVVQAHAFHLTNTVSATFNPVRKYGNLLTQVLT